MRIFENHGGKVDNEDKCRLDISLELQRSKKYVMWDTKKIKFGFPRNNLQIFSKGQFDWRDDGIFETTDKKSTFLGGKFSQNVSFVKQ